MVTRNYSLAATVITLSLIVPFIFPIYLVIILTGLDMLMMWFLLSGFGQYAQSIAQPVLTTRAANCRVGNVVLLFLGLPISWLDRSCSYVLFHPCFITCYFLH